MPMYGSEPAGGILFFKFHQIPSSIFMSDLLSTQDAVCKMTAWMGASGPLQGSSSATTLIDLNGRIQSGCRSSAVLHSVGLEFFLP